MSRAWHDWHSANEIKDEKKREFYISILAEKKPYFMKYIYPELSAKCNNHTKLANLNCIRRFKISLPDLINKDKSTLSEDESEFLKYYEVKSPVGNGACVMNKICHYFEQKFDGFVGEHNAKKSFDYTFMKSGAEYTKYQSEQIAKLYKEYNKKLKDMADCINIERSNKLDMADSVNEIKNTFVTECEKICPDKKALCDMILDITYTKSSTKRFAWDMCGDTIIENLLEKNDYCISFPTRDIDGDISYCGETFTIETISMEGNENDE